MPSVQTYIKEEDYEKYKIIKASGSGAWSEFIHTALQGGPVSPLNHYVQKAAEAVGKVRDGGVAQDFQSLKQRFDRREEWDIQDARDSITEPEYQSLDDVA